MSIKLKMASLLKNADMQTQTYVGSLNMISFRLGLDGALNERE